MLYVLAMVAVIVVMDFAFFRGYFWERLMVNVGIVLVFAALPRFSEDFVDDLHRHSRGLGRAQ